MSFLLALAGIGLGVSGILFFDKEAVKGSAGNFRSQSSLVTDKIDSATPQAHGAGDAGDLKRD